MFDSNIKILKYNIKNIFLKYLIKIVKSAIYKATIIILLTTYNNIIKNLEWFYKSEGNKKKIRPLKNLVPAWRNEYIITVFKLLLTPLNIPLKYLFTAALVMAIPKNALSRNLLNM